MAAAMEAATPRHHYGGQGRQHHPSSQSLPASPTLTNPDMILPDYERSDSPDPDLDGRDHSPLMMWKNAHVQAHALTTPTDMHQMFALATPGPQALDHPYGPTGPITPTTPIIYGNGTMLSDIGEVTEVESTPGKPSPRWAKPMARRLESPTRGSGSDAALRSSPTMGVAAMMTKKSQKSLASQRDRRSSIGSNSTITTEEQTALFADFDDAASVGDSVFQGDDEESLASSYVEGAPAVEQTRLAAPNTDSMDRLSIYSTTSLSRKAEQILANAKTRLTTMEGNLTRARSSLHITPPLYGSDASTPSPPFQRASTALHSRDSDPASPTAQSPGHTRMSSDIAMRNGLPYRVAIPRSQSALGAAGGYRQPLSASKSADQVRGSMNDEDGRPTSKISSGRDTNLQPLTEDEVAQLEEPDRSSQGSRPDNFLSPTFGPVSGEFGNGGVKNLQRSASAAQMRDIKDQMKDLKGKISNLREQARVDSMKRRSLQSLRTPSPFTHSQIDQWYAEPPSNRASAILNPVEAPRNPWNGEESSVDGDVKPYPEEPKGVSPEDDDDFFTDEGDDAQLMPVSSHPSERSAGLVAAPEDGEADSEYKDAASDVLFEDVEVEEEMPAGFQEVVDVGYTSESGESLYHDTLQHPISHEDREDAFDYEHFFLHSAMGTMGRRGSRDSFTSEDSIETTRGPVVGKATAGTVVDDTASPGNARLVTRRSSIASISTIETFATAEEGRLRRSGETSRVDSRIDDGPRSFSNEVGAFAESSRDRSGSTATSRSLPMGAGSVRRSIIVARDSDDSISSIPEEGSDSQQSRQSRRFSAIRRPISTSASASLHRPSISSFESTGTTRSFPLVNRTKKSNSIGVLTPGSSPDQYLKNISDALLSETASICEQQQMEDENNRHHGDGSDVARTEGAASSNSSNANTSYHLQTLMREDKYLVEGLVASLGRCVLGLTENGRASAESRMYRRRIDAARRILEGLQEIGPA
ncbi:hypothetical protein B0T26DRAFT_507298 [Lasiosphaeria miniovina]|uniref:Uncharacterized protein n=1 Tax=Lasiosphaeria miniovina TaxID=1954250 RepID=A0AA40DKX1_9PEZI|nr:uncharacterized protein B0T26DRAFT_507298 [Lasiosphaeria miniovina]KAK0703608.1 hypothetical protein B0T26DRAFT_507298 [Lasiosphaeria miniovina]